MNSFGLGLVLNFVDNASAGMSSATRTFMNMSATADSMTSSVSASATELASIAFSLSAVGDTMSSIGESITNVFTGLTNQVISTGMSMQGYRMQLAALYGSTEAGEQKLQEIKDYAMASVFDIESLIPSVTMMKAVGIEAMQEVTTSSGSATQKLLDYASDIAAMVPNMRNTYGTGVAAAMGALKEYIAEGNDLSLKRGAGLDITGILGEDKGSTIEERTQQIADLVDKLNIVGYTASLAGTPTQRLSNMQDALFNTMSKIADSGVFEVYCGLLETLSNWVFTLVEDEETFNLITGILADTVSTILSPLQKLLDLVIENSNAIIGWIKEHPKLTKNILVVTAAIGGFLLVGGKALKLLSSLALAGTGFKMLQSLPKALSLLGGGFTGLIAKILPFVALASLVYFVWSNNIFGLRDVVTEALSDIGTIFGIVRDAWDDNTLSEENFVKARELGILPFIEALLQLRYYWDFFVEGFKAGFKAFFDGIVKSLEWLKIAGIDVNGIVSSFGEFLKSLTEVGAEDKWRAIGEAAGQIAGALVTLIVLINVVKPVIPIITGVGKAFTVVGKIGRGLWSFFKILFNPLTSAIPKVISAFGDLGAAIQLLKEGFSFTEVFSALFPKFSAFLSTVGGFFAKIGGWFSALGAKIGTFFSSVGSSISSAWGSITTALGSGAAVAEMFGGIASAIAGLILYIPNLIDMFKNGENASNSLKSALGALLMVIGGVLIAIAVGASAVVVAIVAAVVAVIAGLGMLIAVIVNHWEEIKYWFTNTLPQWLSDTVQNIGQFFSDVWQTISNWFSNIFSAIGQFFSNIWNAVSTWFTDTINSIKTFFVNVATAILNNPVVQSVLNMLSAIWDCIVTVGETIVTFISGVAETIWNVIKLIGTTVAGVAQVIWEVIKGVAETIWTCIEGLWNFIVTCAEGIWNVIKGVIDVIVSAVQSAWEIIKAIGYTIYEFFRVIFYGILAIGKIIIEGIADFFTWLWSKIQPILQAIGDFFSYIFNWVYTNVIQPVFNWIVTAFNNVKTWITNALQAIGNFFSTIFNWVYTSVIQPFCNWVTNVFTTIKNFICNAIQAIADFFSKIFNWINNNVLTPFKNFIGGVFDWINSKVTAVTNWLSESFTAAANAVKNVFNGVKSFFSGVWSSITSGAKSFFDWIGGKLSWLTDTISSIGDFFGGAISSAGDWLSGVGNKLKNFVGLDTGGYVKTTGIAVLHPNEVVVNDDTTKRLQNFLGQFENNTVNGIVRPDDEPKQAVVNNIYPTLMESVPVTTVPAETAPVENNNSSVTSNNVQTFVVNNTSQPTTQTEEKSIDNSVTFEAGSVVIQIMNATEAELEKAAEKLMAIIARKQQLKAMATRA